MRLEHVLRRLAQQPTFTAIAVLTLAIGIGANSAIFAVVDGVLLKPLPYPQPEQLVDVNQTAPGVGMERTGGAPFLYFTYRDSSRTFQHVGLWTNETMTLTGVDVPEEIPILDVTDGVMEALGIQPVLGRPLTAADDRPGAPATIVLTYGYWQSKFGGDRAVIGRRLVLDGRPREVVAVMPATFRFLDLKPSGIVPLQLDPAKTFLGNFSYDAMARLKPGVTMAQADADVARMIPMSLDRFPAAPGFPRKMFDQARLAPALRPLKASMVGDVGAMLWILMGTVGLVLLIACANVANLLLVRAEGRQHELSVRAALGASWRDLVRELLVESTVLGLLGGAAGLVLAYGGLRILTALAPANLPRAEQIALDPQALAFTFVIALAAGVLFGLIPALKYAGPRVGRTLRSEGRSLTLSRERHRARNTLVVVQVALALVLLVSAGLMIRTFQALRRVDPGFTHPESLQTFRISIPEGAVKDPTAVVRLWQALTDKVAAVPGVSSVGLTSIVPMDTGGGWHDPIFAEDHAYAEGQLPPLRLFKVVSPGLLATMGNRLVAGRDFTWAETYEARPVAMVSENLARELWSSPAAAIGKRIRPSSQAAYREIVGVVADEHDSGVSEKAPTIAYWPILMRDFEGGEVFIRRYLAFAVRTNRAGSASLRSDLQNAVWSVNANLPLASPRTMQEVYERSLARTSFALVMLAIAAVMALLLGVTGIYGVISYSVSQRTREIGIRRALGAQNEQVTGMFVRHGARLAVIGIACGLVAAAGLARAMTALLFEIRPLDPLTYAGVSLGLAAAAILASYLPALRATRVNPVEALRAE
ncbi:MAG: ABC transporter permease [Betaproteobacteria bacterium]